MSTATPKAITRTSRLLVAGHIHVREFDGELVILDLDKGCYFGLDEVGTQMWQLMSNGLSVEQAMEQLLPEYNTTCERMLQDFLSLGNEWLERGLVQVSEESK